MKTYFSTICFVFAVMLYFLYTMMSSMAFFVGGTLFAIPGIQGIFSTKCGDLRIFTIIVFLSSLMNMLMTSYGIGGSIIFLATCGITYLCLKDLKTFFTVSLVLFLWLVAFLYYQLIILGTVSGDIFLDYGLSRNYPGSMLVIFNCVWAVWKYLHYHRLPLVLPILSTVMALLLDGRSSLICMVLITQLCLTLRGSGRTRMVTFSLLTIALVYLTYHYWDYIVLSYESAELASFTKKGLDNSTRTEIWSSYFNHLDIVSIIFGLDTDNLSVLKDVSGNPHNSFLSFHRRMGLLGILALLYIIIKGIKILINKKQLVFLCIYIILLFRMFVDGMLTTAQDFFILTLFFIPLCYTNRVLRIESQINSKSVNKYEKLLDKVVYIM